jgi:hypothetical protein
VPVKITSRDRGWEKLKRALLKDGPSVFGKAGIIGDAAAASRGGHDGKVTNADLALIHEFGLGVPERSFIRAAFDANRPKYLELLQRFAAAVYDGKMTVERALDLLAQEAASDMRNLIRAGEGIPPPNSPETIAEKGSSRPLVDSAQMLGSIAGAVTKEKPE